jgi:hypothetical protein
LLGVRYAADGVDLLASGLEFSEGFVGGNRLKRDAGGAGFAYTHEGGLSCCQIEGCDGIQAVFGAITDLDGADANFCFVGRHAQLGVTTRDE